MEVGLLLDSRGIGFWLLSRFWERITTNLYHLLTIDWPTGFPNATEHLGDQSSLAAIFGASNRWCSRSISQKQHQVRRQIVCSNGIVKVGTKQSQETPSSNYRMCLKTLFLRNPIVSFSKNQQNSQWLLGYTSWDTQPTTNNLYVTHSDCIFGFFVKKKIPTRSSTCLSLMLFHRILQLFCGVLPSWAALLWFSEVVFFWGGRGVKMVKRWGYGEFRPCYFLGTKDNNENQGYLENNKPKTST